ncbi:MAG: peptidylprolyl isomerase [Burkholderiales bacterium]|jgi:peptidyl-prolyl cis-trans isomerase SurA|nr:peptidylprolyl isomerase [Burkholderiales bacterium]
MTPFRPLLLAALAAAFVLASAADARAAREPILLDRVVAVVNSEVITRLELDRQLESATRQLVRQGTPLPQKALLERQLLDRMITTRVLQQVAKETGLRIEESQVDRAVGRIAQENRMDVTAFRAALADDGTDFAQFRDELRDELVIARLREREIESRVVVSDAEIENWLRTQAAVGRNDEYSLLHILVTVPEASAPDQIQTRRARAEDALAKLKGGADFVQVSSTISDAPNALQGGDLGWRTAGRLPNLFAQAVVAMKVGDLSPILRSPNGFHILKLVDKRSNEQPVVVQQSRARHILVRVNEAVSEADAKRRLELALQRIRAGADFADVARTVSEDASAPRGGELGWLSPGDTVPEFEKAMEALAVNQVSEPVQSPFGWHLIQVLERRTEDLTKERQRRVAQQAVRSRKTEEQFTEWVRQQRDRAFVELRLEER